MHHGSGNWGLALVFGALGMSDRTFRYDYFIIWGNGLRHDEAILQMLRDEPKLEIVEVFRHPIADMRGFIMDLYAHDSVPLEHLAAKIEYLYNEPPELFAVFARHFDPEEIYFDNPWGRYVRSHYIHLLKERIRNRFNPYIDGVRTMQNVIHASDHEIQVDHALKLLGRGEGIRNLYRRFGPSRRGPGQKPETVVPPAVQSDAAVSSPPVRASTNPRI